jgi:hypothetical protein
MPFLRRLAIELDDIMKCIIYAGLQFFLEFHIQGIIGSTFYGPKKKHI